MPPLAQGSGAATEAMIRLQPRRWPKFSQQQPVLGLEGQTLQGLGEPCPVFQPQGKLLRSPSLLPAWGLECRPHPSW